ncbi:MAG: matrixin family metalloprotease [Bdellovibrionaceae bacterium]|nr:matrixin family metalloprotease [Pseudobdellovibrionaceae bacterium]
MKNLISVLFLLTLLFTQACGKKPSPEEACHFQQNSYYQRVSWAGHLPIKLAAHVSLSSDQLQALQDAVKIWNETHMKEWGVSTGFFEIADESYKGAPFAEDGHSVISVASRWTGKPLEQAETSLHWNGSTVVDSDIRLNGEKPFSTSSTVKSGTIDLVALFVHELGHVLGLLHIKTSQYTVMAPELERGTNKRREPGNLELDALRCEY